MRTLGDSGVLSISFQPYLDTGDSAVPFELYLNTARYISFYETAAKTTAVPSLLESLDFPVERIPMTESDRGWSGASHLFNPMANDFVTAYYAAGGGFTDTPIISFLSCPMAACVDNPGLMSEHALAHHLFSVHRIHKHGLIMETH